MTAQGTGLLAPFDQVAGWLQRSLPARWRGLVVMGPQGDPAVLPRGSAVRVELPDSAILWREIDLPAVPAERRAAAIAARLDEISPWAPGAYHWAEGGVTQGKLRVALTAAAPLRALSARLAESGHRLSDVQGAGLWLVEDSAGRHALARRLSLAWALIVGGAVAATLWGAVQLSEARQSGELAQARLEKLAASAGQIDDVSRAALDLAATKTPAASLAKALDRLALGLPLDTWLETLRLTPVDFTISGRSAAPDAIIPALQGQGGFTEVDFAGASARDAGSGLYTFTLQGKIGGAK